MRVMLRGNEESEIYDVIQVEHDAELNNWEFLIMDANGDMFSKNYSELVILRGDA